MPPPFHPAGGAPAAGGDAGRSGALQWIIAAPPTTAAVPEMMSLSTSAPVNGNCPRLAGATAGTGAVRASPAGSTWVGGRGGGLVIAPAGATVMIDGTTSATEPAPSALTKNRRRPTSCSDKGLAPSMPMPVSGLPSGVPFQTRGCDI